MTELEKIACIEEWKSKGCYASLMFHLLGEGLSRGKISRSDFLSMSKMIGIEIHPGEERSLYQALGLDYEELLLESKEGLDISKDLAQA